MPANCYRFDLQTRGWFPLEYDVPPQVIYLQEGSNLTSLLMGGDDGVLYNLGDGSDDNGVDISCTVQTPAIDFGDTRSTKLPIDTMLDADPAQVDIQIVLTGNNTSLPISVTQITGSSRLQFQTPIANTSLTLYRNIVAEITWSSALTPILYEFQPNILFQPYVAKNYSTQFLTHNWTHYGHLRDSEFVYISTTDITFAITIGDEIPSASETFTLPSSAGLFAKAYIVLPPLKGKMVKYDAYADTEFLVFTDETFVTAKPWGGGGAYQPFYPFIGQTAGNKVGG